MPTEWSISEAVNEKGTAVIEVRFVDEDGQAVTPKTGTYTLTDDEGNVVNSRQDVAISNLASSVNIVLSGDDLQISSGFSGSADWRILTVEITYDSNYGTDLPQKDTLKFAVNNLTAVT